MHALLLPGTHPLRRSRDEVQLGLSPGRAVRVDLTPAAAWDPTARDAWDAVPPAVLDRLLRAGVAAPDDRPLREALPPQDDRRAWERHTLAALFRADPEGMDATIARRRVHEVTVTSFGHPVGARLADDLRALCRRSGLPLIDDRPPGPAPKDSPPRRAVHVLVGAGEPRRDLLDPLVRDGVPHLLVRLVEGTVTLGPFVEPGSSPCLRCLDAHQAAVDPAWPLLVEQHARASERERPDGVPEPVDAALAALAMAWAARDLATHAEGRRPATLGTTVRIEPGLESLATQAWPQHPACGCGWS